MSEAEAIFKILFFSFLASGKIPSECLFVLILIAKLEREEYLRFLNRTKSHHVDANCM